MSPLGVFFGNKGIFFFFQEGGVIVVLPTPIYRKYHISTRFLINIIFFHFPPKEKIYFLEKRNTNFPDITKMIVFRCEFLGKTILSEHLKTISYFQIYFWERSSFLLCLKNEITFSGERNIIFPDNTRKVIFQWDGKLEGPSFQNIWKKETWFFVQCWKRIEQWRKNKINYQKIHNDS